MAKTLTIEDTFLSFDSSTGVIELRSNDPRLPADRLKLSVSANTESYRLLYGLLKAENAVEEDALPPEGTLRITDASELSVAGKDPRHNLQIGLASHSEPVELDLSSNLLVAGATGSGKSILLRNILCYGLTNPYAQVVALDMKRVEFGGYSYRVGDHLATEREEAMEILRNLEDTVDRRWSQIEAIGLEHYLETDLPAIYLLVDELWPLIEQYPGNSPEVLRENRISKSIERSLWILSSSLGRGAGIHTVIGSQSGKAIPEKIRRELGAEILMGAAAPEVARAIFGESARYGSAYLTPRGRGVLHRDGEQTLFQSYFIPYDAHKTPRAA